MIIYLKCWFENIELKSLVENIFKGFLCKVTALYSNFILDEVKRMKKYIFKI